MDKRSLGFCIVALLPVLLIVTQVCVCVSCGIVTVLMQDIPVPSAAAAACYAFVTSLSAFVC